MNRLALTAVAGVVAVVASVDKPSGSTRSAMKRSGVMRCTYTRPLPGRRTEALVQESVPRRRSRSGSKWMSTPFQKRSGSSCERGR
jgi:hypothetical protein